MYKKILSEIEAVAFDWDGTLKPIDKLRIYQAHLKIYKYLNIEPNEHYKNFETYNKWGGIPDGFYGKDMESRIEYQGIFHNYYDKFVSPFSWAECIIKEISKRYKLAIFSNSLTSAIKLQLGDLVDYFEIIVGCDRVNNMKPDPEGLIRISNKLEVKPEDILLIGDTETDVITARNINAMIGVVNWGMGDFNELLKHNPNYIFISPLNLMDI